MMLFVVARLTVEVELVNIIKYHSLLSEIMAVLYFGQRLCITRSIFRRSIGSCPKEKSVLAWRRLRG